MENERYEKNLLINTLKDKIKTIIKDGNLEKLGTYVAKTNKTDIFTKAKLEKKLNELQ